MRTKPIQETLFLVLITLAPKKLIRTRRASEGNASEPSLARRVRMCKDAKLSCRGNTCRLRNQKQSLTPRACFGSSRRTQRFPEEPKHLQDKDLSVHVNIRLTYT